MAILLVITVLLPLVGSVALFLMPRLPVASARTLALAFTLATLGLTAVLVLGFKVGVDGYQFAFAGEKGQLGLGWMPRLGVRFALGLDGISLLMFALTALLMISAVFASWTSVTEKAPAHYALLLALETGLLGLFASLDVILFYIFFEFTLIPMFFLIGVYGGPQRNRASIVFFLYTLAGSLLTLIGVIALVAVHYQYSADHTLTFSIPELTRGLANLKWDEWTAVHTWGDWRRDLPFWSTPQVLIFLLLFAGFAIKVPLFPFHTWLPLAHVEAPTAGSIILAGVLLKVGSYGFFRFNMAMTPLGAQALYPLMATLAVIGILYGALAALAQSDVKRLVAYSSVSHMGFILLGLFSLNATGMEGAVIQMLNHGLTTGALFACVGVIYERYHTRDMGELNGLWNRLPVWAFMFILASLGSVALPGLNGFIGEFPILVGMYKTSPMFAVWASLGMILGAYYLLTMLQKVVFGPLREPEVHHHHDSTPDHDHHAPAHGGVRPMGWHDAAGLIPLLVLIVLIGVYPRPFLDRLKPPVAPVAARFEARPTATAATASVGLGGAPAMPAVMIGD